MGHSAILPIQSNKFTDVKPASQIALMSSVRPTNTYTSYLNPNTTGPAHPYPFNKRSPSFLYNLNASCSESAVSPGKRCKKKG